jgi:hypothetical protein
LPYCVSTTALGKEDPPLTDDGHRRCSLLMMNPAGSGCIHEVHSLGSDRGTKQGSKLLRWGAIEAVSANHGGTRLQADYHRVAERRRKNKARVAVARRPPHAGVLRAARWDHPVPAAQPGPGVSRLANDRTRFV